MPAGTVSIDRMTIFGNPFVVGKHGSRVECVEMFEALVSGFTSDVTGFDALTQHAWRSAMLGGLPALRGRDLACWCRLDQRCHGDVLLKIADEPPA
jgi:hypothetical protein